MTTTPTIGPVRSGWGKRKALIPGMTTFHRGVDIGVPVGTPVVAPAAGTVMTSTYNLIRGHYVVIDHGGGWSTEHQHLSKRLAAKGQPVAEDQLIGLSGRTGNVTAAHLHTEVRYLGTPVDPAPWYLARGVILGSAVRVAGHSIVNENGDTMIGVVLVALHRPHVLIGPMGPHDLTTEEWEEAVKPKMAERGLVEVIDLSTEGEVGTRRYDLLRATLTQVTA